MSRSLALLFGLMAAASCPRADADAPPATLSVDEARRLAEQALPAATKRLPGLDLEAYEKPANAGQCWTFDVLWANPAEASVHTAFYAVDRRTGDVWEPTTCRRVTGRALARAGEAVRKRLGVGSRELLESRARPACCR
jgi:hypothetical protein